MRHLKKVVLGLILFAVFGLLNFKIDKTEPVLNAQPNDERMLKAVWVTPFVGDVNVNGESSFKSNMTNVLNNMENFGYNALIFHVRTHNNAFYPSNLNPKATYVSNINFSSFDPIEWLVNESHARGIELHAWMNPYRTGTQFTGSMPSANPASNPDNLITNGTDKILDPAKTVVKNFVANTVKEFVEMYDVDAVHFDDYFYINNIQNYSLSEADKRGHVNDMIEKVSNVLKTHNTNNNKFVQLGISPTGIYRNGNGLVNYYDGKVYSSGSAGTRGQQHYGNYLCADTLHWMNEKWIDYIMPQIYWSRTEPAAPYKTVLDWWSEVTSYLDVNLYVGLGLYRAEEKSDSTKWGYYSDELDEQITLIENDPEAKGYTMFSYKHFNSSSGSYKMQMNNAYNNRPDRKEISVLPELKSMTPVIPSATQANHSGGTLSWGSVSEAKFYYIYRSTGTLSYSTDELYAVVGKDTFTYNTGDTSNNYNYGVKVLSGTNHLSGSSSSGGPTTTYNISFNLNGGSFSGYNTKTSLATAFLTDFHSFVNASDSLNTFMHGAGKTSGFDGTWYSNESYLNLMYKANTKSGDNGYFASSFIYQSKWKPFFDMMENFVKAGNPGQDFWSSTYTGNLRIKQYFTNTKPSVAWSNEDMNMMPVGLGQSVPSTYTSNSSTITLPSVTKEGSTFGGWYNNPNFTGGAVTTIPSGSSGNKTFYAKWNDQSFTISYVLNGGEMSASGYNDRDSMLMAFFTDYHAFVKPGISLNDFVHGSGKTSGYGGTYDESTYFNQLYAANSKGINASTGKFINQPEYNNWVPLFDLIDQYVTAVNAGQNFWGSPYTGQLRFKPFMQKDLYGKGETEEYVNKVPNGLTGASVLYEYNNSTPTYTLPTPTKNNESFLGWYTSSNFSGSPVTTLPQGSTGNKTYYAKWQNSTPVPTFVTVSFNLGYNGLSLPSVDVEKGNKVTKPANPTRNGYTFLGWYSGSSLYNFNNAVNSNLSLIAGWQLDEIEPDMVTVYFDLRYDNLTLPSVSVNRGTKVSKPSDPSRVGYIFKGWYLGNTQFNFNNNIDYNLTLSAKWEEDYEQCDCVEVTFNYGYNGTTSVTQVERGKKVIKPADPRRDGYIFKGWYFVNELYNFNNPVNYNITLIAEWEADGSNYDYVTVTFDHGYDNKKTTTEVIRGNAVTKPTNPTRDGYLFTGWYFIDNLYDFNTPVSYGITLIAQWQVDVSPTVVVTFNYGYGDNQTVTIDKGAKVSNPGVPVRSGYTFDGWLLNGQPYNFNNAVNNNITLVAKWVSDTANQVTVKFDYDYDNLSHDDVIDAGTKVTKPADPLRPGYVFKGWYLANNLFEFSSPVDYNITLVAKWEASSVNVTFDVDGKKEVIPVTPKTKIEMPYTPHKEGHLFTGWYLDGSRYNFNNSVSKSITLKATFIEVKNLRGIAGFGKTEIENETTTGGKGLRFSGIISRAYRRNEHGFYVVFGTTSMTELTNAIETNAKINDKEVFKVIVKGVRKDNSYSVILTGIPSHANNQKITVVPYRIDARKTLYLAEGFLVSSMSEGINVSINTIPFIVKSDFVKVVKNKKEEQ